MNLLITLSSALYKTPRTHVVRFLSVVVLGLSISTQAYGNRSILVFGDSISAAYGIDFEAGWAQLLASELPEIDLVNASVSGETTGGGLTRLPTALEVHNPDLVVLELGGNDGLRGYPIDRIRTNLTQMIQHIRAGGAEVVLVGMVLPPNYGQRYLRKFISMYQDIAETESVRYFLPALLDGLQTPRTFLQQDGIHPTAEAQPLIKNQIQDLITPWLNEAGSKSPSTF